MLFNNPEFVSDSEDEAWLADGPRSIIGPRLVGLPSHRLESLLSAPLRSYISGGDAGKVQQRMRPHSAHAPSKQHSADLGQQRSSKLWTDRQGMTPRGSMHTEPVPQKSRPTSSKLPLGKTRPNGAAMAWQGLEAPVSKGVGAPQFGVRARELHKKARVAENEAFQWLELAHAQQVKDANHRVSHSQAVQAGTIKRAKLLQQSFTEDLKLAWERVSAAEAQRAEWQRAAAANEKSAEIRVRSAEVGAARKMQLMITEASQWTRKAEERAQAAEDRAREQQQADAARQKRTDERLIALEASSVRAAEQLQLVAAVQARQAEDRSEAAWARAREEELAQQLQEVLAALTEAGGRAGAAEARAGATEARADELQGAVDQASKSQRELEQKVHTLEQQSTKPSSEGPLPLNVALTKTGERVVAAEGQASELTRTLERAHESRRRLDMRLCALERQGSEEVLQQAELVKARGRAEAVQAWADALQRCEILEERCKKLEAAQEEKRVPPESAGQEKGGRSAAVEPDAEPMSSTESEQDTSSASGYTSVHSQANEEEVKVPEAEGGVRGEHQGRDKPVTQGQHAEGQQPVG